MIWIDFLKWGGHFNLFYHDLDCPVNNHSPLNFSSDWSKKKYS